MTALAGYWSLSGRPDAGRTCERMLQAQQVYAPDPKSAATWGDREIALGRRLFRQLPEERFDRAPMVSAEGRRVLVADVRLDNRDELADALGIAEPSGLADSAILMAALDRWDEEAVDRLDGDFAFALWDSGRQRLVLARDFMGQRPLHFHRGSDFVAFASMPKGLHALPEVPPAPDRDMLARFLALMPEGGTRTFFAGVERVPAGAICIVTRDGLSTRHYWQPGTTTLRLGRDEEYEEAVRAALDRAVAVRLRGAEQGVGATLSGGLDSSAVAATAARLLGPSGKVAGFTAVPREGYDGAIPHGRFGDEGPLAAAVAARYPNIEHVLVRTNGRSPLATLDRNFFLFERPVLNLCNGVWMDGIMDAAKARRLPVMLTGQMGNMSFSYAGLELLPELLAGGRWLRLAREIARLPGNGIRRRSALAHTIGPFMPGWLWQSINRRMGKHFRLGDYSAVNLATAQALQADAAAAGLDFSYRPRRDPVGTRRWVIGRVDMGNYNKGYLGGWGIDVRDPSADRRLLELCLSIPAEQFLKDGLPRSLARRVLADRLPAAVVQERRKGLQAVDWHEGVAAARDEARLEAERIAAVDGAAEILETGKLGALLDDWPEGGWNSNKVTSRYRLALLRGLSGGHFLRKAAGSNA
ncbi:asparagine synthetase B [Sphingosinicella sp. YJ22]|uniref:asparagine synthetase B family protein n=1 Tax=Sphingosinicella sp. YJ22 TaxID=1104780 RepID=UPI00140B9855|nr:asparagine synthetase B [Sphingosinicella sp. YJ22]